MMKTITFNALGSRIFLALDTEDKAIVAKALEAQQWFEEWEQVLSRFRISSELSEVNRHPGVVKTISSIFSQVMIAAENAGKKSGGLVTPTVLNALINAGYKDDFDSLLNQVPAEFELNLLAPMCACYVTFNRRKQTIVLPFGTQLDFGGIAKGWAAHQVMLRLGENSPILVDAGGDIAISGKMHDGSNWPVGVANPFDEDSNLALLMVENGGVATSGKDYHRWMFNGNMQHHIIDPRNMLPAQTDILTVTVKASNVMDAETYAKTAMILGSEAGKSWLDDQPEIAYLLVLENGSVIKNELFIQYEWKPQWQIN